MSYLSEEDFNKMYEQEYELRQIEEENKKKLQPKQPVRTFTAHKLGDYHTRFNTQDHFVYVCLLTDKATKTKRYAKIGVTKYSTKVRWMSDDVHVLETYEFRFKSGLEAFGVEAMVKAEFTLKYPYEKDQWMRGDTETFQADMLEAAVKEVENCRKAFGITTHQYIEWPTDYEYLDYKDQYLQ